jgi:hypothetical protein
VASLELVEEEKSIKDFVLVFRAVSAGGACFQMLRWKLKFTKCTLTVDSQLKIFFCKKSVIRFELIEQVVGFILFKH